MARAIAASINGPTLIAAVAIVAAAAVAGGCKDRSAVSGSDAASCALVGCAATPLCSEGCTAPCGCCPCAPGERSGDLMCTAGGCYAPPSPPMSDAGSDAADASDAATFTPSPSCALPFDPGPCEAAIAVYAFVDGACMPRSYGGCQGNGNRFMTLEECLAICEGRPAPFGCPSGRAARELCFACAPDDSCMRSLTVCAPTCDPAAAAPACPSTLPSCRDGLCEPIPCG